MLRISLLPEDVSAIEAPMTQECAAKILNKGPCLSEKLETDLSTIGKQRVAFFILDEIYNDIDQKFLMKSKVTYRVHSKCY